MDADAVKILVFLPVWVGFNAFMFKRPDLIRGRFGVRDEDDPVGARVARVRTVIVASIGTVTLVFFLVKDLVR